MSRIEPRCCRHALVDRGGRSVWQGRVAHGPLGSCVRSPPKQGLYIIGEQARHDLLAHLLHLWGSLRLDAIALWRCYLWRAGRWCLRWWLALDALGDAEDAAEDVADTGHAAHAT